MRYWCQIIGMGPLAKLFPAFESDEIDHNERKRFLAGNNFFENFEKWSHSFFEPCHFDGDKNSMGFSEKMMSLYFLYWIRNFIEDNMLFDSVFEFEFLIF